jgi:2-dehydropantoate 2-reductase
MVRYVFLGAGAVGGALGGLLAARGHEVLLVARGRHAEVMAEKGLRLRCPDITFTVPVPTATAPDQVTLTVDDVLVLTTKTQHAVAALDEWMDVPVHDRAGAMVGRAGALLPVLTATNGVAAEEIALRRAERVFGMCLWFPVVMIEPGEVIVRGAPLRGVFHIGRYGGSPDADADRALVDGLREQWAGADLRVVPSAEVMRWKYRKLLLNLGNALEALVGDADVADVRQALADEARTVLDAAGVAVAGDDEARVDWGDWTRGVVPGEPAVLGGSSWQSLARGSGSIEADYLNGEIALIARRIGRPAPLNAGLTALAREAARDRRAPGATSAAELRTRLAL